MKAKINIGDYAITLDENGVLEINASVGTLNLIPRSNTRIELNIVKKDKAKDEKDTE